MSHLDATFGVEFEVILPVGTTFQQAAAAVTAGGVDCYAETYNHIRRPHWKVVTDGSLSARGAEFVSPVLRGLDGLVQVEKVCQALTALGATIDRSCGMHVHVGVARAPLSFFKNLVKLYAAFEPVIDAMLPNSRRLSNNTFCRSMTAASAARVDAATNMEQLARAATGQVRGESRYYKLNLAAFARHQTIEFRQHSGTVDAEKARRWIELCLRMVECAKRANFALTVGQVRNTARAGTKSHLIGQMMLRPEGVTGREAIAAANWPSVSLPQQARACGLSFTTQRTGREVRYFAVQQTSGAAEISIAGFVSMIGATAADRGYIEARTVALTRAVPLAA